MEALHNFFDTVGGWVWGPVMLVFLVGTGVLLTVLLKGLQFSMLGYALKQAFMPHHKKRRRQRPRRRYFAFRRFDDCTFGHHRHG